MTEQGTRTAAMVLWDAMVERRIGPVLEDDASELLDALADAGYPLLQGVKSEPSEQDTRTAAEVPDKVLMMAALRMLQRSRQLDKKPYRDGDVYGDSWLEAGQVFLAALADAGYTIAGPGSVVVDRGRWERVQSAARYYVLGEGTGFPFMHPGDLDSLPTQEGE